MQKLNFVLLNLVLSSNCPIYIVLNWNLLFNIDDSIDIMAITGLFFLVFLIFYSILKLEIFFLPVKYPQFFKYESEILNKLKSDKKFKTKFLASVFLLDIFFFILNCFVFKYLKWGINSLLHDYVFCLGGALICYVSFLIDPWIKSRFNED